MQNYYAPGNSFYQNYENIAVQCGYAGSNRHSVLKEAAHGFRHDWPGLHSSSAHAKTV